MCALLRVLHRLGPFLGCSFFFLLTAPALAQEDTSLDARVQTWIQKSKSGPTEAIAEIGNGFGSGFLVAAYAASSFLVSKIVHDQEMTDMSSAVIEAFVVSGVQVNLYKIAAGRPRPFTGARSDQWNSPEGVFGNYAFPSGHTASAFAMATVLAAYTESWILKSLYFSLALSTAYGRMHENKHWLTDVLAGAYVGYHAARTVLISRRKIKPSRYDFMIIPLAMPNRSRSVGALGLFTISRIP